MTIRPATDSDWPHVRRLAESLIAGHHEFDRSRFIDLKTLDGDTYVSHVRDMIRHGRATLLVADHDGQIIGYVFAGVEAANWKELRPEAGYIHDIVVDEARRKSGSGRALMHSAIEWLTQQHVQLIMLWSAHKNTRAQRLFAELGLRPTMVEMTLDIADAKRLLDLQSS
jgi:GNAT superfamily N-acetyltransferase